MPVFRVNATPINVQKFDVLASTRKNYVRHVAMAQEAKQVKAGDFMLAVEMAPPMETDVPFSPHLVGHGVLTGPAVNLEEYRRIQEFLDETKGNFEKHRARADFPLEPKWYQYVVHPYYVEMDKNHPVDRYSCAGFVFEAYRVADVTLLDVESLPSIPYADVLRAYPEYGRAPEQLVEWIGLEGDGPWPIMMPGYLMASLNRSAEEIRLTPYTPQPEDMRFPPPALATPQNK